MKKALLIAAVGLTLTACGKDEDKKVVQVEPAKVIPKPLALDGFDSTGLALEGNDCGYQRAFVSWFVAKYAEQFSTEDLACINPNSENEALPAEFDGLVPRCANDTDCSLYVFGLKNGGDNFKFAARIDQKRAAGSKPSPLLIKAPDDRFQVFFPQKPIDESYYKFIVDDAKDAELPLIFVTFDASVKQL